MNPLVEAAWIALIGVGVGVGGTVTVARIGFTSTAKAIRKQIEAERDGRIWDKQAAAYTDAIAGIIHRQKIRQGLWAFVLTMTEPPRPESPVDWRELQPRLLAYASPDVLDALSAAGTAGQKFEQLVGLLNDYRQEVPPDAVAARPPGTDRAAIEKALAEANRLDDVLIDQIRKELHARAEARRSQPVPLAPALPSDG